MKHTVIEFLLIDERTKADGIAMIVLDENCLNLLDPKGIQKATIYLTHQGLK